MMQLMLAQPKIDIDSPVVPQVEFDPPVVKPGEESTYRVTLNALETAVDWPEKIPAPSSVECTAGARGQILSLSGSLLVPRTTFNYHVRASQPGQFTIPEFSVTANGKRIQVPAAGLEVSTNPPPGIAPAQLLLLQLPTNSLYVGQTVRARVILPGTAGGLLQSLTQVQVNGRGFIVDQSFTRAHIEAVPVGPTRRMVSAFIYELLLTPIATGKISVAAQGYAIGNRVIGGVIMPAPGNPGLPPYTLVDSDPVLVEVRPLPRGSQLAGFTGAVGTYSMDTPELSTNVMTAGQPVKLSVKVRGDGNLARLVPPQPPRISDWEVFAAPLESTPPQIMAAQGFVTFSYTLIPMTEKTRETPAIPFCAFDPDRGQYQDLTIDPVPVQVLPGSASKADLRELAQADKLDADEDKEPVLSGLALAPGLGGGVIPVQNRGWFPLLHLLPAVSLLALWSWDRRRRFLEQHPDVVLRRRALRALRRHRRRLQQAARAKNDSAFAATAVTAMQAAAAPFYPAEPRALVGGDIIRILPDGERSGPAGQTVRRFFSGVDAARFAPGTTGSTELLQRKGDIEMVLDQLEARLCG